MSSQKLLDELSKLRMGSGLSEARLKHCPNLLRLPAVSSEASRMGWSFDDHHFAAYNVIRCAINFSVRSVEASRILFETLNFPASPHTLTRRRQDLQNALLVSRNTYSEREAEAFIHFAGVLMNLNESPCGEGDRSDLVESDVVAAAGHALEAVVRMLLLVSGERRPLVRERLAKALELHFPDGFSLSTALDLRLEANGGDSSIYRLSKIVHLALLREGGRDLEPTFTRSQVLELFPSRVNPVSLHANQRIQRQNALVALATLMLQIESNGQWELLSVLLPKLRRPHPTGAELAAIPGNKFLSVSQAATILNVSKMTIYRLIHGEEFYTVRVGRSVRIPLSSLVEYADDFGISLDVVGILEQ